jgi:hypothetical protein
MSSGERISRKLKQGDIEIDYDEISLIVNYIVETVIEKSHLSFEKYLLLRLCLSI